MHHIISNIRVGFNCNLKQFDRKNTGRDDILSGRNSERNDNYGAKDFWDQRYHGDEQDVTNGLKNECREDEKNRLYEWYLSYDEFKDILLPELVKIGDFDSNVILISGCGNSTLCEDLYHSGNSNAIDFMSWNDNDNSISWNGYWLHI
jgi:hypothetical protein